MLSKILPLSLMGITSAEKADLSFGIDQEFVQMVSDTIAPYLIAQLNSVHAENIILENGYFKNIHLNILEGDVKDFAINFKPENKSLSFNAKKLLGQITMDWRLC